jgi:hypothetical protein
MTRINCIPVEDLYDQHLLAEYREITRVAKLARELRDYGKYTMGAGHVKFFYNKGQYLRRRAEELFDECLARGFNVQYKEYLEHPDGLNSDWMPSREAIMINMERIQEKLDAKPDFYRKTEKKY